MKTKDVVYFSVCAFLVAFALSYCAVPVFHLQLPRYYPTLGQWRLTTEKEYPSMAWYGQTGFAMLLGTAVGVLAYLLFRYILKYQLPDRSIWYRLAGVAAIASILLALFYFLWYEGHRWFI